MTPDPQPTEQEEGEWMLFSRGPAGNYYPMGRLNMVLIRVSGKTVKDLRHAVRDPANVYRVEGYPKVVEMLTDAGNYFGKPTGQPPLCPEEALADAIAAALAAVHPEGANK